jgi:hypothetical protein
VVQSGAAGGVAEKRPGPEGTPGLPAPQLMQNAAAGKVNGIGLRACATAAAQCEVILARILIMPL